MWNDVHAVLFAAKPVGSALKIQPGETIEVRYFPFEEIPDELLFGHRRRILDAIHEGQWDRSKTGTQPVGEKQRNPSGALRVEGSIRTAAAAILSGSSLRGRNSMKSWKWAKDEHETNNLARIRPCAYIRR